MIGFRTRLTLVHQAVIVVVLTVTALTAYWTLSREVHGQLDAALLALAETEAAALPERAGDAGQTVSVHEAVAVGAPPAFERLDRLLQILGADGTVLARSHNLGAARLPVSPDLPGRLAAGEVVFETLHSFGNEPVRMVSLPVEHRGAVRAVQVAGSLDDVNHVVATASLLFVVMGVALLLTVGTAGFLLTRGAFRAIDDVVDQARRIGDASLGRRLPHPGVDDEIGRLVRTLNEMLDRLEHGFEAQRRFTADASHELRSPLSRLRTELELALRRPREPAAYIAALRSSMEEVERLTLLVEELLTLARIDAGQERGPAENASLAMLADEAVARQSRAAQERGVHIALASALAGPAWVARGPASLVLGNLLDNAVKFSAPGDQVSLRIAADAANALIVVRDHGPGIGTQDLPYVFERFFRGSAARAGTVPGIGLGLALSQAILHAHGGHIDASSARGGGAEFTVRLPLASAPTAS
ncbi:sensor histidine kinase [Variovorax sp. PAMC 28711]|uniref:sensor histidine kinase n=1 Tax=Variovorax sp. PAMC 28711 TaxID=1795631 RepID=UPI00078D54EC|nr:HAMP domain-containing sensor histidine kinase [Variovorax sp. PAMC 28711]AMM24148.1 histidine kinase [Variovorax sp. PAMC 28711]